MTQMKRYTIFLDWKTQYCEMIILLKTIYRFHAIPMAFFFQKNRTNSQNLNEDTKDPKSQDNIEEEKQSQKEQSPRLRMIL